MDKDGWRKEGEGTRMKRTRDSGKMEDKMEIGEIGKIGHGNYSLLLLSIPPIPHFLYLSLFPLYIYSSFSACPSLPPWARPEPVVEGD